MIDEGVCSYITTLTCYMTRLTELNTIYALAAEKFSVCDLRVNNACTHSVDIFICYIL